MKADSYFKRKLLGLFLTGLTACLMGTAIAHDATNTDNNSTVFSGFSADLNNAELLQAPPAMAKGLAVSISHPSCGQCDGYASVSVPGPAYSVLWSDGQVGVTASGLCPGTYSAVITKNGVPLSQQLVTILNGPCSDVWPGDCDLDGFATKTDIFPLGLHYGATGPARAQPIDWSFSPQAAANWNGIQANGLNLKHCDPDGNGIVGSGDKDIVRQNLTFTSPTGTVVTPAALSKYYTLSQTTSITPSGSRFEVLSQFFLTGPNNGPGIYAVAFSIDYATLLDSLELDEDSIFFSMVNSWLGTPNVDAMYLAAYSPSLKRLDVGITRTDLMGVNGAGIIAELSGITPDQLVAKDLERFMAAVDDGIIEVIAIDNNGDEVPVLTEKQINGRADNAVRNLEALVFPNPSNGVFNLSLKGATDNGIEVRVVNMVGQTVHRMSAQNGVQSIDLSDFPKGLYLMELTGDQGRVIKRVSTAGK